MKAIILAAGLGSRLGALTKNKPKPLVEINGKPIIDFVLDKLKDSGITDIGVNLHYHADILREYLLSKKDFNFFFHYEPVLLGPGGALTNFIDFIGADKDILVHNADIYSEFSVKDLIKEHQGSKNDLTLLTSNFSKSFNLVFKNGQFFDWVGAPGFQPESYELAGFQKESYLGIKIINKEILKYFINEESPFNPFIVYNKLKSDFKISYLDHNQKAWFDVGKIENILELEEYLKNRII